MGAVDDVRRRQDASDLPPVEWPSVTDDPDAWSSITDLGEGSPALAEIRPDHQRRLTDRLNAATDALSELAAAETSLHARLLQPLRNLYAEGHQLAEPGGVCPVCATHHIDWLGRLGIAIDGIIDFDGPERRCGAALAALRGSVGNELRDVLAVLQQIGPGSPTALARDAVRAAADDFVEAIDQDGQRPTGVVRAATQHLGESLLAPGWAAAADEAVERSDHRQQWLHARSGAISPFVDVWRAVREDATHAKSWESAQARLRDLQNSLRKARAAALRAGSHLAVQQLLAEAGLTVKEVSVQGTKAAFDLVDADDRPVALSMLSAGQRNALLLAPLLAVSRGGPFGFLVVDDPVHAFDQIRVDRLASILEELARDRRVLVLTHDERLKEHVVARVPNCDVRAVQRDPVTGRVAVESTGAMWKVLVDDARAALQLPGGQPGGGHHRADRSRSRLVSNGRGQRTPPVRHRERRPARS